MKIALPMKKVISILLVLTMAIGLAVIPVFAAQTEGTATKTFTYNDEILRDVITVDLVVTATGSYSRVDNYSRMSSITASASGPLAYRLSFGYSTSGNQGTLHIYDLGTHIYNYRYRINASGGITLVSKDRLV